MIDDVYFVKPEGKRASHEGSNASNLLQPNHSNQKMIFYINKSSLLPNMLEAKSADIINHSDSSNLCFHLPSDKLHENIGGGVELLHRNSVWVPLAWTGNNNVNSDD